jgi:hypothetical protein
LDKAEESLFQSSDKMADEPDEQVEKVGHVV